MSSNWSNDYYQWLLSFVEAEDLTDPEFSHMLLMERLHSAAFIWLVPGDRNRDDDGRYLRTRFIEEFDEDASLGIRESIPSVLEVLIALAERMSFSSLDDRFGTTEACFWIMLQNMGIAYITDAAYMDDPLNAVLAIEDAVAMLNDRGYTKDGFGGPFPVPDSKHRNYKDARKVELWYQMHDYLMANQSIID